MGEEKEGNDVKKGGKKEEIIYASTVWIKEEQRRERGFEGKSLILGRIPTLSHTKEKKKTQMVWLRPAETSGLGHTMFFYLPPSSPSFLISQSIHKPPRLELSPKTSLLKVAVKQFDIPQLYYLVVLLYSIII